MANKKKNDNINLNLKDFNEILSNQKIIIDNQAIIIEKKNDDNYLNLNDLKEMLSNQKIIIDNQAIIIENQNTIINKLTNTTHKSDLQSFAEITKLNINSAIQTNMTNTIRKTINENNVNVEKNKSIILYNVKMENDDNFETRTSNELNKIHDILKNTECDYKITKYHRIGKYDDKANKIRPIKITFNTENEKQDIINSAHKLKNTQYSKISISQEYTKEQLIEIQKLSIEAKGKTINGHKFVVRCSIHNTFKIIELQNKNE